MSTRRRKTRFVREKIETDHLTGNVKKTEQEYYGKNSEPPFVKAYLEDILKIYDVPSGPRHLFPGLIKYMDYELTISLNTHNVNKLCKSLDIKAQTFRNYMQILIDLDFIKRISRGVYQLNPNFFARGNWSDIEQARETFKTIINYSPKTGRSIEIEL